MPRLPLPVGFGGCSRLEERERIGRGIEDALGDMRWLVDIEPEG